MFRKETKMLQRVSRWISIIVVFMLCLAILPSASASPIGAPSEPTAPQAVTATALSQSFDSGTLPTGWQVTGTPGWRFDSFRGVGMGGARKFAIADSFKAGLVLMDTQLRTPALDLSTAAGVKLIFKTYYLPFNVSIADVDVSANGGTTWTNLWRQTTATYQGAVTLNVPQAAGKSNVVFRFHYYNANYEWFWAVDDVEVQTIAPPTAPGTLSAVVAGSNVNLTWADNSSDETNFIVERSPDGASGWVEAGRVGANVTTFTHQDVACGSSVYYRVKAANGSAQSGYSNTANIAMPSCPPVSPFFNENFDRSAALPSGWTVVNQYSGAAYTWQFNQPNLLGTTGNAPIAKNGKGSQLRTLVLNFQNEATVLLKFNSRLINYADQNPPQSVDVDISQDGGATWTNVWRRNAEYDGQELVILDISAQAARRSNLMVRFFSHLFYGGGYEYWQIDNVVFGPVPPLSKPANLAAALIGNSNVLLGWRGTEAAKYKLERSANAGSTWTQIADLTDGATTYADTNVTSFTSYQYRVRAYNSSGQSSFSDAAGITTGDRNVRYVDATISLYPTATLAAAADRAKYENIIRYFADGVYESSNGANRLRKVTIYRNNKNFDIANVQWIQKCWPNASVGGYIRPGTGVRVQMCDVFQSDNFLASDADQKDGGATLAHEWGHFFYGLYDEYTGSAGANDWDGSPRTTDPGTSVAIMNNQWKGFGDYRYLNFSAVAPNSGFTLQSAQGRVFGASAWATLARPKSQDPQTGDASRRPYWPELAAAAPAAGQMPRIDLPNAAARATLQIVWEPVFATRVTHGPNAVLTAANGVVREIVIDRSALMADNGYLNGVKSAVATLINQTPAGDTLGLIAFDGTATVVQPLTDILDQTTKDTLIAAADGIAAGDTYSAGGDALQAALTALTAPSVPTDTRRVVYYLTAGSNPTGTQPIMATPGYQTAGIPLYVFGFDPLAGAKTGLRQLADLTQGEYTTVRNVADLQKAFNLAEQATSPRQDVTLAYDQNLVAAGNTFTYTLAVDASLDEVDFKFAYSGEAITAVLTLTNPAGALLPINPATDCKTYGAGANAVTNCWVSYLNPAGDWTVSFTPTADNVLVDYEAGVAPEGQTTYRAALAAVDGDVVEYPQPIVLQATASRGYPIGGLNAIGWVHEPDGVVNAVAFHDDGIAPDTIADDGAYSAYVDYTAGGERRITVHFNNSDSAGFYTDKGLMTTGSPPLTTISENFERYAEVQVTVQDWQADDHANWPDDPNWPATALTLDNVPAQGRIDSANDVDVFAITVPNDYTDTLGVRINRLGLGMDPYIVAYAADYAWQFERSLDSTPTTDEQLFFPIDATPGKTCYIEVRHRSETATTGTYNVSAGPNLWSDPTTNGSPANERIEVLYTLTVATTGAGQGMVIGAYGDTVLAPLQLANIVSGTVITLTAVPSTTSVFADWSGAVVTTTSSVTLTMDANQAVTATFDLIPITYYTLTVATTGTGGGTVIKSPDAISYTAGTVVSLTATANAGSTFAGWTGDASGLVNPVTVTMTANKTVTATFTLGCIEVGGVDFTFAPTAPKAGTPVVFSGLALTGTTPITYTWNFGDSGAAEVGQVATHTFAFTTTAHVYTVTLTAANACSTATAQKPVTVQPYRVFLPLTLIQP
jgi:uncharacterized repeat protein (TIGR02543 family)